MKLHAIYGTTYKDLEKENKELQQKINKIRKYIKKCMRTTLKINDYWTNELVNAIDILKIIGDKEK